MHKLDTKYKTIDNCFVLNFKPNKYKLIIIYNPTLFDKARLFFNLDVSNFDNTIEFKSKKELIFNLENFYNYVDQEVPKFILQATSYIVDNKYILARNHFLDKYMWSAYFSDDYQKELASELQNLLATGNTKNEAIRNLELKLKSFKA